MSWTDVLAAVGGGATGLDSAQRYYDNQARQAEAANLRAIISVLSQQGMMDRAAMASADRRRGQDLTHDEKASQLAETTAKRLDDSKKWQASLDQSWNIFQGRDATTRRGQDLADDRFWGGTMPLGWERDYTTQRGQDIGATTARRGQDVSASNAALASETSQRNADEAAAVTQRGQDITDERGRAGINQRSMQNIFAPDAAPVTIPARPPTVTAPARVPTPVGPRGGAPAAAPQSAAPSKFIVGQVVKVKGQNRRITAVYPDGSFDADPVK